MFQIESTNQGRATFLTKKIPSKPAHFNHNFENELQMNCSLQQVSG